jgi:hypothetical protein
MGFLEILLILFAVIFVVFMLGSRSLPPVDRDLDPTYVMRPQRWVGWLFFGSVAFFLALLVAAVIFLVETLS